MCGKLIYKTLYFVIIAIALSLAILVSVWHQQALAYIIFVSRFFDVMLPILAVGALLKYLLSRHHICKCDESCWCHKEEK